jgi:hypothetical protein
MKPKLVTATQAELDEILGLARAAFPTRQYELLVAILGTFAYVMQALENAKMSVKRFRKMWFGVRTESKANVLVQPVADVGGGNGCSAEADGAIAVSGAAVAQADATDAPPQSAVVAPPAKARRGHGRNGARAYSGATVVEAASTPGRRAPSSR